jgi:anti-repressor protein
MSAAHVPVLCIFSPPSGDPLRSFTDAAGDLWFITNDVLPAMGLSCGPKALSRVELLDKGRVGKDNAYGLHPDTTVINEAGMYTIASSSRGDAAKAFVRWMSSHVHPTVHVLRQAGKRAAV